MRSVYIYMYVHIVGLLGPRNLPFKSEQIDDENREIVIMIHGAYCVIIG